MQYRFAHLLAVLMLAISAFTACSEKIDMSDRYTFMDETVMSYLEKNDTSFSEYIALLNTLTVSDYSESLMSSLLSARGHYTCFAPNNHAIQLYLDSLYRSGLITSPSWDGFKNEHDLDSIQRVIVFNSIIDGGDQTSYDVATFPENEHEFRISNMNDRKLKVIYGSVNPDSIFIDGKAPMSMKNRGIEVINGYVHEMEAVIAPSNDRLGDFFRIWAMGGKSGYTVMSKLILACGLDDTLNAFRDEVWERMYLTGQFKDLETHNTFNQVGTMPEHRYYGFTIFAETDAFWEQTLGKAATDITVEDVKAYLEGTGLFSIIPATTFDNNYEDSLNILNQFVTYHILPQRISRERLVIHYNELGYNYGVSSQPGIPIMDYYQTMGVPRLLKTYESRQSEGIYLNRFPVLKNGRGRFAPERENANTYHESGDFFPIRGAATSPAENEGIRIEMAQDQNVDNSSIANGVIYPITKLLVCTENVCTQLTTQRIRIDAGCLMPELMTNDIRSFRDYFPTGATNCRGFPTNYQYISNVEIFEGTKFYYLPGYRCNWYNLQGDEFNVIGRYDFIMKLPPVTRAGHYEIRFGVATGSSWRSMAQVYFGADRNNMPAVGIPMDLRMGGLERRLVGEVQESGVGWEQDSGDEEYDEVVNKRMRAIGFMKAPNSWCATPGSATTVRAAHFITRRVMVSADLQPFKNYYIRFKSVLDDEKKEFFMDYFEYVAKEVYDNPNESEDIW